MLYKLVKYKHGYIVYILYTKMVAKISSYTSCCETLVPICHRADVHAGHIKLLD